MIFSGPAMIMKSVSYRGSWLAAAVLLGAVAPSPAIAQNGHVVVNCLDPDLGTVQKTLASDCKGQAITEDEAEAARSERRSYVQKALSKVPDSSLTGMHLASIGSGFFIAEDGSVLTSHHIVDDCAGVSVAPTFGEMVLATTVVPDDEADLALLRTNVKPPGIAPFSHGNGSAVMGAAYVSGYPEQGMVSLAPILTAVEVLRRETATPHGAATIVRGSIRKGNSGGPLLDTGGNVIGVVVAKLDTVTIYKTTGEVVGDIGLVLPADRVRRFLDAQNVDYHRDQRRPLQPEARLLEDARPFMVQVGCWQ
jgi:serine protease Do